MRIFKEKKFQLVSMILINFLSIIELYAIYKLIVVYKGIHSISYFITMVLFQVYCVCRLVFNKDNINRRYKSAVVYTALIIISTPVLLLVTQPEYSYQEGKVKIENTIELDTNYDFIDYPRGQNTIPVTNDSKRIFIKNRYYYYRLSDGTNYIFLMVDPISGIVVKLDHEYWSEDRVDN